MINTNANIIRQSTGDTRRVPVVTAFTMDSITQATLTFDQDIITNLEDTTSFTLKNGVLTVQPTSITITNNTVQLIFAVDTGFIAADTLTGTYAHGTFPLTGVNSLLATPPFVDAPMINNIP